MTSCSGFPSTVQARERRLRAAKKLRGLDCSIGWTADPIYRSLRLFPDSAARFAGEQAQLAPVADYTNKWNVVDLRALALRTSRP
jgi:hypothetical protein